MTAKKKLIRNIAVSVIALAALGGAYYFAVNWTPADKEENKTEQTEPSAISLFSIDSDSIASVSIRNPEQAYTLVQGDDGTVTIPEKSGIEFMQSSLKSAVYGFASVSAEREITSDITRAAEFGLEPCSAEFVVNQKDGSRNRFIIGDALPGDDAGYYMMEDNGDRIYTISSYNAKKIFKTTDSYRSTSLASIDSSTIKRISVAKNGNTLLEIRAAEKGGTTLSNMTSDFVVTIPYPGEAASSDMLSKLAESFKTIEIKGFADDNPSDLDAYGLGKSKTVLTINTSDDKEYKLALGSAAEDGVYMQWNDVASVYIGDKAYLDAVEALNPIDYVSKLVEIHNIADVESVDIMKDGVVLKLEIDQSKQDEDSGKFKVNGKEMAEKDFKKLYQQVIGVTFTDYAAEKVSGQPFMTITYNMSDGSRSMVELYDYNERCYAARRSNGNCLTVLKSSMEELFKAIEDNKG